MTAHSNVNPWAASMRLEAFFGRPDLWIGAEAKHLGKTARSPPIGGRLIASDHRVMSVVRAESCAIPPRVFALAMGNIWFVPHQALAASDTAVGQVSHAASYITPADLGPTLVLAATEQRLTIRAASA